MSARNTAHVSNQQWIIAVLIAMTKKCRNTEVTGGGGIVDFDSQFQGEPVPCSRDGGQGKPGAAADLMTRPGNKGLNVKLEEGPAFNCPPPKTHSWITSQNSATFWEPRAQTQAPVEDILHSTYNI